MLSYVIGGKTIHIEWKWNIATQMEIDGIFLWATNNRECNKVAGVKGRWIFCFFLSMMFLVQSAVFVDFMNSFGNLHINITSMCTESC